MADDNDDFLIRLAVAGDPAALATLLQDIEPQLLAYAERRLPSSVRSHVSPGDIVQETCYEACRLISGFEPRGSQSLFHWMKRIANLRIKRVIERFRSRKTRVASEGDGSDDSVLGALANVAAYRRTPSASAAAHEFVFAVEAALARINGDYRKVLQHRFLEGLDVTETATRMGRSNESVAVLCCRALTALRRQLESASHYR